MESRGVFYVDPDFCSRCGTFLNVSAKEGVLKCINCGFSEDLSSRKPTVMRLNFSNNRASKKSMEGSRDEKSRIFIDKVCPNCQHPQMIYSSFQSRSADEGQTVFYSCEKCNYREFEYS